MSQSEWLQEEIFREKEPSKLNILNSEMLLAAVLPTRPRGLLCDSSTSNAIRPAYGNALRPRFRVRLTPHLFIYENSRNG